MSHRVLGRQLEMWIPAHQFMDSDNIEPGDFHRGYPERHAAGWEGKLRTAKTNRKHPDLDGQTLVESVRERGIEDPVTVEHTSRGGRILTQGHHRVATAHHLDPNYLVPVMHREGF